jgi:dephospho-CoA kinase
MTVGIIGGRGTGKTIFVSLLANTAIKYSAETKEHFRYWTSPEFTQLFKIL